MSDTDDAAQLQMPALPIKSVDAWGASPDGTEAVIIVGTVRGPARLVMDFTVLSDLVETAKSAKHQAGKNAKGAGVDLISAVPVNKFSVGHAQGVEGVLMIIDPDMPTEVSYVLRTPEETCALGGLLMQEGRQRQRIAAAISGTKKITTPAKRRIILPGEQ